MLSPCLIISFSLKLHIKNNGFNKLKRLLKKAMPGGVTLHGEGGRGVGGGGCNDMAVQTTSTPQNVPCTRTYTHYWKVQNDDEATSYHSYHCSWSVYDLRVK